MHLNMAEINAATLQKLLDGQNKLFEGLQQIHHKLDSVVSEFRGEIDELKQENQRLKKNLQQVTSRLDKQEQHSRSKNVVIYDVPGSAGESREETESKVAKITEAVSLKHKVLVAHRLNPSSDSPIIAIFESKAHAQEMLHAMRLNILTADDIGLKGQQDTRRNSKRLSARPHLCPALAQLLKAASALKAEAKWGWTKVITSRMEVQIFKGNDDDGHASPPVIVRSLEDVLRLRLQLVEQGSLPDISPEAHAVATKKRPRTSTDPKTRTLSKEKRLV